tara:strand:- start:15291 stop:15518 length:228 start_codon:yes stop_codon:yes gene_type:complete
LAYSSSVSFQNDITDAEKDFIYLPRISTALGKSFTKKYEIIFCISYIGHEMRAREKRLSGNMKLFSTSVISGCGT